MLRNAILPLLFFAAWFSPARAATALRFEVGLADGLVTNAPTGRLLVFLARQENPEPRLNRANTGPDAPFLVARDADNLTPGTISVLDEKSLTAPITNLSELPPGDYFAQALLMSNPDIRLPNAPGNLYSEVLKVRLDPSASKTVHLKLSRQIPPEKLPPDTKMLRYIKMPSPLLSKFYGRPMFLRAGIILPRDYEREPSRKYPLWVRIGGWGSRYTSVKSSMERNEFRQMWLANETPRFILLQLDGAGPLGDPYQVNSANNGPYGDAVTQELIPFVEKTFRGIGEPRARVLSGVSTGGWVSLALQVFYPDFFNGTWSSCPDPVDFRAFQLVNIYEDDNAYVNESGFERPSERSVLGDVRLTMRREVQLENILGTGDSWTMSGGQWCNWNATYGPRGRDGKPAVLWDPQTGRIDHAVAEQWKKMDLRLVMENNWKTLGPKLQGKLHIAVGEADNYFLNNAVHLLDDFLSHADPPYHGRIVYGPGKGHGWMDVTTAQMMKEMEAATKAP